jgi:hypothetical protein
MAALFAYTVVITSRPAAVAASERARPPKPVVDQGRFVAPSLSDPSARLRRLGR